MQLIRILAIVLAVWPVSAFAWTHGTPAAVPAIAFTALANGTVSSTVAGSGTYTLAAPSNLTGATWGGGCSGASTVSGFSAAANAWNATFTTPVGAGSGCTLTVTGTGSNTGSATSPGVTISSGAPSAFLLAVMSDSAALNYSDLGRLTPDRPAETWAFGSPSSSFLSAALYGNDAANYSDLGGL